MQPKEPSVSSFWIQSDRSKHSTDKKNSLSGIQKNPKMTSSLRTQKKPFTQYSKPARDGKATQKLAQRPWERIPKKPELFFGHNWNLATTCVCQVRRRSKHSISWASVIFSQASTTWTILTTESLFRRLLITIAYVDYALVKESKMAETLRAQGPPQVRLLMASDWPSDVPVPSKRVMCANAQHKRFATTLFSSVPRDTLFPSREHFNRSLFWGFFPSVPLLLLALLLCLPWPGLAPLPAWPGRPGFLSVCLSLLFLSGPWFVRVLRCSALLFMCLRFFFQSFRGSLARHMGVNE